MEMAPTKSERLKRHFRLTDAIANLHACVGEGEAAISQAVSVTRYCVSFDLIWRC